MVQHLTQSLRTLRSLLHSPLHSSQAKGQQISEPFRIIPNTIVMARKPSNEPRMLLYTEPPNVICETNKAFCDLFGYGFDDIINKWTLDKVGGNEKMRTAISSNFPANHVVTCQRRDGTHFFMNLKLFPLTNGETPFVSHYLGVCQQVKIDPSVFQRESNAMQHLGAGAGFNMANPASTHPSIASNPEFAKQMAIASRRTPGYQVHRGGHHPGVTHPGGLVNSAHVNVNPAHVNSAHLAQHPAQHPAHPSTYPSAYPIHPAHPSQIMGSMGGPLFAPNFQPMPMGGAEVGSVPLAAQQGGRGGGVVVGGGASRSGGSKKTKKNETKN